MFHILLLLSCCYCCMLTPAAAAPAAARAATTTLRTHINFPQDRNHHRNDSQLTPPEAVLFMRRFGYLDPGPADSEALYTEDAIQRGIRQVQKFGGVPQTGVLDEKTMKVR